MSGGLDPDLQRRMEAAFRNLTRRQQKVFLAHRVQGMSYPEIADRIGLTVRQVERQVARAIYKLAKQMNGEALSWWERRF